MTIVRKKLHMRKGDSMRSNDKRFIALTIVLCISSIMGLSGCSHKTKSGTDIKTSTNITQAPTDTEVPEIVIPKEKSALKLTFSKSSGVYEGTFDLEITCD